MPTWLDSVHGPIEPHQREDKTYRSDNIMEIHEVNSGWGQGYIVVVNLQITRDGLVELCQRLEKYTDIIVYIGEPSLIEPVDWSPVLNHASVSRVSIGLYYQTGCFWPLMTLSPKLELRYEFAGNYYNVYRPAYTSDDRELLCIYFWRWTPVCDRSIYTDRAYLISCIWPIEWARLFRALHEVAKKDIFGRLSIPPGLIHYLAEFMGLPMSPTMQKWLYVLEPCMKTMRI